MSFLISGVVRKLAKTAGIAPQIVQGYGGQITKKSILGFGLTFQINLALKL
ncbi:hypothetical protein F8S20_17380 [Nostoc sp. BAE]|nr:hypothetical protein [Nostoc commune BAE]